MITEAPCLRAAAATSQPIQPAPTIDDARRPRVNRSRRVSESAVGAQGEQAVEVAARHVEPARRRSGGEQQLVVADVVAAGDHQLGGPVDPGDRGAATGDRSLVGVEAPRPRPSPARRRRRAAPPWTAAAARTGSSVSSPIRISSPGVALVAERDGGRCAGQRGADDDDAVRGGQLTSTSCAHRAAAACGDEWRVDLVAEAEAAGRAGHHAESFRGMKRGVAHSGLFAARSRAHPCGLRSSSRGATEQLRDAPRRLPPADPSSPGRWPRRWPARRPAWAAPYGRTSGPRRPCPRRTPSRAPAARRSAGSATSAPRSSSQAQITSPRAISSRVVFRPTR